MIDMKRLNNPKNDMKDYDAAPTGKMASMAENLKRRDPGYYEPRRVSHGATMLSTNRRETRPVSFDLQIPRTCF